MNNNTTFETLNSKTLTKAQIARAYKAEKISRNEALYLLYCNGFISLNELIAIEAQ